MHAHGVEILDGADDDGVVGDVAHHLQFEFLPAQHALFDQHLVDRRKVEPALDQFHHLFAVVGDAAAGAAQREAGPQDHRVRDALGEFQRVVEIVDQLRFRALQADAAHGIFEHQPVFGLLDGADLRADQFHAVAVEHARFGQFHREVQSGLAAHGRKEGVGPLLADHFFEESEAEGLDVGSIGQVGVGHDGGRVGVDQDHLVAIRLQGFARLGARVVELARLPDHDGAGTHD